VLQYSFNWKQLSVIAGISYWQFYFRLFPGSIKGPQIIEFLKALKAQIKRKLLIIWDGLGVHKSRLVREFIESLKGQIVEFLPAYAPSKEHCSGAYCPQLAVDHDAFERAERNLARQASSKIAW